MLLFSYSTCNSNFWEWFVERIHFLKLSKQHNILWFALLVNLACYVCTYRYNEDINLFKNWNIFSHNGIHYYEIASLLYQVT